MIKICYNEYENCIITGGKMKNQPTFYNETEIDYKRSKDNDRKIAVTRDIQKIDGVLEKQVLDQVMDVHVYIDGKYGAYVPNWEVGTYGYIPKFGFNYESIDVTSMIHNLKLMKAKLEGYAAGFEKVHVGTRMPSNNVNVSVHNANEVTLTVTFEETRQKIDNMTSLTEEETSEILNRLSILEEIINSGERKKSKWEKAKPILTWLAEKSFDVGMAILPLLLKIAE